MGDMLWQLLAAPLLCPASLYQKNCTIHPHLQRRLPVGYGHWCYSGQSAEVAHTVQLPARCSGAGHSWHETLAEVYFNSALTLHASI